MGQEQTVTVDLAVAKDQRRHFGIFAVLAEIMMSRPHETIAGRASKKLRGEQKNDEISESKHGHGYGEIALFCDVHRRFEVLMFTPIDLSSLYRAARALRLSLESS